MSALIITQEFKEPSGESTYSKNIVKALSQIYDDVYILNVRESIIPRELFNRRLLSNTQLDVHFVGYPLLTHNALTFYNALLKISRLRVFTYNFGFITGNDPFTAIGNLGRIFLSNLARRIFILTTSLNMFLKFRYLSPLRLRYIPAPIDIPPTIVKKNFNDELTVLYIGQAYYIRFPYDKILYAIKLVHGSGIPIKLIARFSTRHLDPKLIKYTKQLIDKLGLRKYVDMKVHNMTIDEKESLFLEANSLLYPAIKPSATDPPAVVLEAMSRGLCVLTTRTHSLAILKPNLFYTIDGMKLAKDLAHKMMLLTDRKTVMKLVEKSVSFVKQFHSLESFINAIFRYINAG